MSKEGLKNRLPAMGGQSGFVSAGGLISYGGDFSEGWRLAARYVRVRFGTAAWRHGAMRASTSAATLNKNTGSIPQREATTSGSLGSPLFLKV